MHIPLWEWKPYFISYAYWHKKDKFQFRQDSYAEWVMFAVENGSFRYRIGETAGTALFGDAILCPPGVVFEREVLDPVSFHFIRLGWPTDSFPLVRSNAASSRNEEVSHFTPPVQLTFIDHNRLSSTYSYMHQLTRLPDEQRLLLWDHYLNDLWQQYQMESGFSQQADDRKDKDSKIVEATRRLQQYAYEPISLKELSASLDLSPVQFTRKFHAAHGTTPIDYLTTLRIQKAQKLLLETEMTLEQIAERCGYESGFYLSRVFTRKMKVSPSHYRKMHRV
ncbi:Helix-turn-helix domain-containing protein [Paenibacillus sp. 1_12]|uniref:AraC family transcriptional regulator n=1 Tax=Paenibacillus sp. 1_12 TaxID=1566278 RepID=UPI0008E7D481|nr:helix-turn-helix domain-containing protein [Paenibacillus sp. 1_12]SFL73220.1 Helix-turn-helix domain-containing protein [Paenibacillus sp. 1_12]